jgi:hypothetical protein
MKLGDAFAPASAIGLSKLKTALRCLWFSPPTLGRSSVITFDYANDKEDLQYCIWGIGTSEEYESPRRKGTYYRKFFSESMWHSKEKRDSWMQLATPKGLTKAADTLLSRRLADSRTLHTDIRYYDRVLESSQKGSDAEEAMKSENKDMDCDRGLRRISQRP